MPEIESQPITWKSFQSLPQLAFVTWIIVFSLDAVLISPNRNIEDFRKLVLVWIIGLSISMILESLRIYKKREKSPERGDLLFIPINALLIFFYASAYNGFTKQVGSWNEASTILQKSESIIEKKETQKGSLFAAVQAWAVPVLANQTSYWPDLKTMAENSELKHEIKQFQLGTSAEGVDILSLNKKIDQLEKEIASLRSKPSKGTGKDDLNGRIIELENLNAALQDDFGKKSDELASCSSRLQEVINYNGDQQARWEKLVSNINTFNNVQEGWRKFLTGNVKGQDQARTLQNIANGIFNSEDHYNILIMNPIQVPD